MEIPYQLKQNKNHYQLDLANNIDHNDQSIEQDFQSFIQINEIEENLLDSHGDIQSQLSAQFYGKEKKTKDRFIETQFNTYAQQVIQKTKSSRLVIDSKNKQFRQKQYQLKSSYNINFTNPNLNNQYSISQINSFKQTRSIQTIRNNSRLFITKQNSNQNDTNNHTNQNYNSIKLINNRVSGQLQLAKEGQKKNTLNQVQIELDQNPANKTKLDDNKNLRKVIKDIYLPNLVNNLTEGSRKNSKNKLITLKETGGPQTQKQGKVKHLVLNFPESKQNFSFQKGNPFKTTYIPLKQKNK